MKYLMLMLMITSNSFAGSEHEQDVHNTAHFGASFAINQFSFAIYQNAFKMEKRDAIILSVFTTLLIGFSYKYLEAMSLPGSGIPGLGQSMLWNGIGVGASVLTIKIGNF